MAHQTASAWKSQAGYANVNSVLDWVKVQFAGAVPALRTLGVLMMWVLLSQKRTLAFMDVIQLCLA